MTGRSSLENVFPEAACEIHPADARDLGIESNDWLKVSSRRGSITVGALITKRSPVGTIFIPFHLAEAAVNLLTLDCVDARAKIPNYKNTSVKIVKTSMPNSWDAGYKQPLLERGAIKDPNQVH